MPINPIKNKGGLLARRVDRVAAVREGIINSIKSNKSQDILINQIKSKWAVTPSRRRNGADRCRSMCNSLGNE